MTHTPEPWKVVKHNDSNLYGAQNINHSQWFLFESALEKDATRIVACVNAMAGITDPQAFRDSVDKLTAYAKEVAEMIRQREERIKELENHILELGSQM